jgi:hypothetical protein
VTLLFSSLRGETFRVVTDVHGRYRIRLPAGRYTVRRPGPTTIGRKLEPSHVRVLPARIVGIDFFIDTGIR